MGIWTRIRQNLSLKIVSLIAALLLYIYVQQERNPTIQKTVLVNIEYRKAPDGMEVIPSIQQLQVTVTGSRQSVERLTDGAVKAVVDLSGITSNLPNTQVRLTYELPRNLPDLKLDSSQDFVSVQVYRQKARKLGIEAFFNRASMPGLRYGEATIHPSQVTVRGREDRVNRINKIVAFAAPVETNAPIDGDFPVTVWDNDQNVIAGLEIVPDKVHVTVRLVPLPAEQLVSVQTPQLDRPAAPYVVADTRYVPNQVRIIGPAQRIAEIRSITTETLSVHDLTSTTTMDATLIIPPGVLVRDQHGKPITHVSVTFIITKSKVDPVPSPDGSTPTPPKHDGTTSP